ncbi:hypothetical protein GUJ93_ZPchr0006g44963 [Zizania palustris]|uniref:Uncharacterized protein n=1 Tax=Zizania palustris TaxID=103762 RepID=A0A8J5W2C7_ZIZPA|nr:hypothetical protein GUJ93_ZPchr0006g42578 [Zizania palustris]KAG8074461.1 hypothetical protein GUJ93_ZPchr0006g44963 [Zizania palustris]
MDREFTPTDARRGERGGAVVAAAPSLCAGEDSREEDQEFTPADARRGERGGAVVAAAQELAVKTKGGR